MGLAARGSRQLGDEVEKIEDEKELAQVRSQARRVQMKAVAFGLVITLVVLLIP
ncbi:MAG: hypothetical protein WAM60_24545 [Candidatus Promineifilaceae bacterium]